jgi:molecular chaperone GrpE
MVDDMDQAPPSDQEAQKGEAGDEYGHLSQDEQVEALRRDLEGVRVEAEQHRDLAQRAQAEMSNYRKRTEDDRIAQQQFSNSRLLIKFLPVADELELALDHADGKRPGKSWIEGVKLIQRKVSSLLESEGISKIEALGIPFDPLEHEAVGTEETTKFPSGHVVKVVRSGYRLHDRVIQPAQVVVAR